MARECIFRASGGTRFKNFCQPWWQKGGGGTPRCNQSAQKNSGYVTVMYCSWDIERKRQFFVVLGYFFPFYPSNNLENQNLDKMKKNSGDIIILHMSTIYEVP